MQHSDAWCVQQASRVLADGYYKFAAPLLASKENHKNHTATPQLSLLIEEDVTPEFEYAVRSGRAIAEGMALTKDLGSLPGNVCNPGISRMPLGRWVRSSVSPSMCSSVKTWRSWAWRVRCRSGARRISLAASSSMKYSGSEVWCQADRADWQGRDVRHGGVSLKPRRRPGHDEVRHVWRLPVSSVR